LSAEGINLEKNLDKSFLQDVLGFGPVRGVPQADAIETTGIEGIKRVLGFPLSRNTVFYDFCLLLHTCSMADTSTVKWLHGKGKKNEEKCKPIFYLLGKSS